MYTVLVVDPERAREGGAPLVDWSAHRARCIGVAGTGRDALHRIEREAPQIVITDLALPDMDGLELIRRTKELLPSTQFVVLTGYAAFDAARGAMRFGVRHYLVKPCGEAAIARALRDAADDIRFCERCARCGRTEPCEPLRPEHADEGQSVGAELVRYVQEHLTDESLSLTRLSKEVFFLNSEYLGRLFKQQTGEKFSQYVTKARMALAAKLLAEREDLKVADVAELVGFGAHPHYFSLTFKKTMGCSPTEYKAIAEPSFAVGASG
ncbi:response regulator transcription factor [Paenibacillus sp.]|uniref:response regulator transcription factor n=1 Tax=Paenibacillus sp. TaxID=58172 RepID=UPI002D66B950|nr:helix-turn-helix domain-containing protein [Paenibacillus sp.]HZG86539.1 helix-turn-helix domain-containing protein [Paenibacillus sp.]